MTTTESNRQTSNLIEPQDLNPRLTKIMSDHNFIFFN